MEIQIADKEIYQKAKKWSVWCSDLTQVLVIPDQHADDLIRLGVPQSDIPQEAAKTVQHAVVSVENDKKMVLQHADLETLLFCGCRSDWDTRVPPMMFGRLAFLLQNGSVRPDQSFVEHFGKMGWKDQADQLFLSQCRIRCGKKGLLSLQKLLNDDVVKAKTLAGIFGSSKIAETKRAYRQFQMEITGCERKEGVKWWSLYGVDAQSKNLMELRWWAVTPALEQLGKQVGRVIPVATTKVESWNETYVLDSPLVIPWGMDVVTLSSYRSPTRAVPTSIFDMCYHEVLYRTGDPVLS